MFFSFETSAPGSAEIIILGINKKTKNRDFFKTNRDQKKTKARRGRKAKEKRVES